MNFKGNTYLVAGGAGFIGSHIVDRLLSEGAHVRVLDDLTSGHMENLSDSISKIEFVKASIEDAGAVDEAANGCSGIFSLAAIVSVPVSVQEPVRAHKINSLGTLNILEAARKHNARVVLSSSAAIYGDNPNLPLVETETPVPITPYGVQKLNNEHYLAAYHHLHGVNGAALRYFNVYGPKQDPKSPYSGVITIFIRNALAGKPIAINGNGLHTRDFVYVSDVVEANLLALQKGNALTPYNVGTGHKTTLNKLAEKILQETGGTSPLEHNPPREGDIVHSLSNPKRADVDLGFIAKVPLEEGLKSTINYFRIS